jgi:UDP-N-acetylmuramate--alanine ligase
MARDVRLEAFASTSTVVQRQQEGSARTLGRLRLGVPGRHNVLNALAATAVGLELGISFERIAAALEEFRGAERRFQIRGEVDGVLVVDDYGHHPAEIAAVLSAARAGIDRRIVAVFQPHRYSRTQQLLDDFGPAFEGADRIVLTDIYPAGEKPIEGITIDALAASIRRAVPVRVDVVVNFAELPQTVVSMVRPGDLVLTLGAGSIGAAGDRILELLREKGGAA